VTVDVLAARNDWEQGYKRMLDEARDPASAERLLAQINAVTAELRRRVGATFTLRELTEAYLDSERWAREAVAEHAPAPGWSRTLSLVGDAAFYLYARGAVDYTP
jgi:chorismate-pyruvate lyase